MSDPSLILVSCLDMGKDNIFSSLRLYLLLSVEIVAGLPVFTAQFCDTVQLLPSNLWSTEHAHNGFFHPFNCTNKFITWITTAQATTALTLTNDVMWILGNLFVNVVDTSNWPWSCVTPPKKKFELPVAPTANVIAAIRSSVTPTLGGAAKAKPQISPNPMGRCHSSINQGK